MGTAVTRRAMKKERTRELILANAIVLFRSAGIRKTRAAAIAAASDVSDATFFNYFATKDDVAEAWVRGELYDAVARAAREAGDHGLRSGLRACARGLAETSGRERESRREAWRCTSRTRSELFARSRALENWLAREQDEGRIRSDLSAVMLSGSLVASLEEGLVVGLSESDEPRHVAARIQSHLDLVLDGARKRNERVAVSAVRTKAASTLDRR